MEIRAAVAFLSMSVALLHAPAHAAAVFNLSNTVQVVEVYDAGGYTAVQIEPGRAWRMQGPAKVRYDGREVRIDANEEFAIWNNGDFGPQFRVRRRHMSQL